MRALLIGAVAAAVWGGAGCLFPLDDGYGPAGGTHPSGPAPAPGATAGGGHTSYGPAASSGGSDAPCLLDPSDGRHKRCHHVTTDGRCVHYGAWCRP